MSKVLFSEFQKLMEDTRSGSKSCVDEKGRAIERNFRYNKPASSGLLNHIALGEYFVPSELQSLLSISDGFDIYNFKGIDGYRIFGIEDLVSRTGQIRDSYDPSEWDDSILVFGECLGDGSYLATKSDKSLSPVMDCFLETTPDNWREISPSISSFFSRLIASDGKKFWLDQA